MKFLVSADLEQFLDSLEKFFSARFPEKILQGKAIDPEELSKDWRELADLGATAAPLPEDFGGLGMGVLAGYSISEKAARWLSPLPVSESIGVASSIIDLICAQNKPGKASLSSVATEMASGATICRDLISSVSNSVIENSDLTKTALPGSLKVVGLGEITATNESSNLVDVVPRLIAAAEFSGMCLRVVELTNEYVKTRKQFGRTIGSFQAVQHKLADMLMWSEQISSLGTFAAWAADNDYSQFESAAIAAFGYGAEFCPKLIETSVQLHGGIGFTYEYPLHLYLRRALALANRYGGVTAAYNQLTLIQ